MTDITEAGMLTESLSSRSEKVEKETMYNLSEERLLLRGEVMTYEWHNFEQSLCG
jgi:hypothetical protein